MIIIKEEDLKQLEYIKDQINKVKLVSTYNLIVNSLIKEILGVIIMMFSGYNVFNIKDNPLKYFIEIKIEYWISINSNHCFSYIYEEHPFSEKELDIDINKYDDIVERNILYSYNSLLTSVINSKEIKKVFSIIYEK